MSDVPVMQTMETAPKDGTPIRLFAPYLPTWGMVHVWQYHPGTGVTGWCTARGLACFEWSGWKSLPDDVLFAIAAEREACAKLLDDLAREARTARDNHRVLDNPELEATLAMRHNARASAFTFGADAIRARGG